MVTGLVTAASTIPRSAEIVPYPPRIRTGAGSESMGNLFDIDLKFSAPSDTLFAFYNEALNPVLPTV